MAFDSKTFFTRLLSAVFFSAIMLGTFLWNEISFVLLFLLVTILCQHEYFSLVEKILCTAFSKTEKMNAMLVGVSAYWVVISLPFFSISNRTAQFFSSFFFFFLGLLIGALIMFFFMRKNKQAHYLLSVIGYIPIALALLVQLRYHSNVLPILFLLFIWMNDTMAYLTGSFFGKTPFAPTISPKKTIEGTMGGIIFTLLFALLWGYFTHWLALIHWISIALMVCVAGTLGDLLESKLKRLAGVKDSGQLMPGHGGALDRFDSLLFTAPFVYLYVLLFINSFNVVILPNSIP
jgi:Predicted CDP-diglyceride synthetase/phosphatidate cytidylyltransferase